MIRPKVEPMGVADGFEWSEKANEKESEAWAFGWVMEPFAWVGSATGGTHLSGEN